MPQRDCPRITHFKRQRGFQHFAGIQPGQLLPFAILNHGTVYLDAYGPRPDNGYWFVASDGGVLLAGWKIVGPL